MTAQIYTTPHDFCHEVMNHKGDLVIKEGCIYESNGILIGVYKKL